MDGYSVYVPRLMPQAENFVAGRRSCKGCGKALTARIASKAAEASVFSQALIKERYPAAESFSAQGYALDDVSSEVLIENFLSYIDRINEQSFKKTKSSHRIIKKAVIGINRQIFMSDFLALERVLQIPGPALYICFDNEPYIDKLIQRASQPPFVLAEKPLPITDEDISRIIQEKQMPAAVTESDFTYIATACPSLPYDLIDKVRKGLDSPGNAFLLVLTPCPTGWIFAPENTIKLGLSAVRTGYFPLYEIEEEKFRLTTQIKKRKPVQEFFMMQKRFFTFPQELIPSFQTAVDMFYNELLSK
jgi:pyruvate ferredoxin oxidoreductase beta subunit